MYGYGSDESITDYYRTATEEVRSKILHETEVQIMGSNLEELVEYFFSEFALPPIRADGSREESMSVDNRVESVDDHFSGRSIEAGAEYVKVVLPIVKNPKISKLKRMTASTYSPSFNPQQIDVGNNDDEVSFEVKIQGFSYNPDSNQAAAAIQAEKNLVLNWMSYCNNDINTGNEVLKRNIRRFIEDRKNAIESSKAKMDAILQKINIPLKKREDSSVTKIRVDTKPLVTRVKPNASQPVEYIIDETHIRDILSIVKNSCDQFEKTPITFASSEEEDLRNIILVGLNTVFEGRATGESFCSKGKTDIYLNIEKGNILVFECKFWGGPKLYQDTIDQLLGYLTWKHNFAVVVCFSRNADFSSVLDSIEHTVTSHPSYKSNFSKQTSTHYRSTHNLRAGDAKEVEIHHLFVDLHTK